MKIALQFLLISILASGASAQSTITLRRSFVDSFCNRLTISAAYNVWFSHPRPNAAKDDGDIHVSGYDNKIGMPVVAEIMNAAEQPEAMNLLKSQAGNGTPNNPKINIAGVWRLWPEHMGPKGNHFYQGMHLTAEEITKKTTNPDHVFEIHPVTKVATLDVRNSLHEIQGYEPWYAWYVLQQIAKKSFTISSDKHSISFTTKQTPYNYVDTWIKMDSVWTVKDGAFAICTILDYDYEHGHDISQKTIAHSIRVGFVKGTAPYDEALAKHNSGVLHVLATTRINLAIVSARESMSHTDPAALTLPLPVELVAVGIITD